MRFTDLDAASEVALRKIIWIEPTFASASPGTRVRLHIEGLGSPMRAHVKGTEATGLVVESELGFLQVGKELELENARTGGKRPARVAQVGVDSTWRRRFPAHRVAPLRRRGHRQARDGSPTAGAQEDTPEPIVIDDEKPQAVAQNASPSKAEDAPKAKAGPSAKAEEDVLGPMRSGVSEVFYRASEKVAPAINRFGAQAKTALALVVARARKATSKTDDVAAPARRTTAPSTRRRASRRGAQGGACRANERGTSARRSAEVGAREAPRGHRVGRGGRWRAGAGGSPQARRDRPDDGAGVDRSGRDGRDRRSPRGRRASAPVASPLPASSPAPVPPPTINLPPPDDTPATSAAQASDEPRAHRRTLHVTPFGNGAVGHANVLHLKMDGPIEKIEGAATPTGFNVVIPDCRSLEAAAPLAARDSRIAAIRVTNESNGAELAVSFKDGVPNYQVRAKGESLEHSSRRRASSPTRTIPPRTSKHKHLKHAIQ